MEPFQVGASVMVPPFVPFSNCWDHWQLYSPKGLLVALRADSIWQGIYWLGNLLNKGCAAPFDLPMLVLFSGTNTPHSTPLLLTPPRIPGLAPWEKGASFSYSSHLPWAGWLGLGLMPSSYIITMSRGMEPTVWPGWEQVSTSRAGVMRPQDWGGVGEGWMPKGESGCHCQTGWHGHWAGQNN